MPTSQFTYINAPLPTVYAPPNVVAVETVGSADVPELLSTNDIVIEPESSSSTAEQILSIFRRPEVLFGEPDFIAEHHDEWIAKIDTFVDAGEPILFSAMAFPYKVPSPIKTGQRRAPDLGEALMLRRFEAVLNAVARVYEPGAELVILEEGILGRCQGVDPADIAAYRAGTARIMAASGVHGIRFHSLDDMVTRIENFEARWYFEQERLRRSWDEGEPTIRRGYAETNPGQRSSIPTREYEPETLVAALDPDRTDSALRYVRQYLDYVAHRQFFAYRALLNLRDCTGYLEEVAPHALKLTVSPKPTNLAVRPVNERTNILPYHGVPVLLRDGSWTIDYFGNLGRRGRLVALHLDGDADPTPAGYRELDE